ncbi:nucleotide disphospho-sugar-binding domain-containing protein [Kitasatospora azatica]|uniref:nucleotide disphospho-sugar-binding domain-containing protein n=1 Tax=Kitasatospora azatica TaxID=58347 RepID=UPI000568C80F|nr:nucleotide disphospho-sugar-binding domain-containing protein [Kitasatospora azatica]
MRVLFVAHGPSHAPWLVPLAWACRLAGHEVQVAARPQAVPKVTAAGLLAVPIGAAAAGEAFARRRLGGSAGRPARVPADWPVGPLDWPEERRLGWADQLLGLADSLADDLVAHARAWRPDLVVHDIGALVGPVAAAAVGVPAIGHAWGQPMGAYFLREDEVPPAYLRMFERFGLEPRIGADTWIDPCPPSLALPYPVPRLPMRYLPYNGPGEIPDWLREHPRRPRICLTGGGTSRTIDERGRQLLDEVDGLDAEIVLAVARPEAFAGQPLPANVRLTGWFPLSALLPSCAALIHHGGAGSGMTAAAYGVPQIVLPESPDSTQRVWGEQVTRAGSGISIGSADLRQRPGTLREAVTAVLGRPHYTDRARSVRAEIEAMPAPAELVRHLERRAAAGI